MTSEILDFQQKKSAHRKLRGIPETGPWPSVDAFIESYNEHTPDNFIACVKVTPMRAEAVRKILVLFPEEEFWLDVWQQCRESRFLSGKTRTEGRRPFRKSIEWFFALNPKKDNYNCLAVYEGVYRDG